ncbi:putative bifunctional diguanylate cyclase/phosphodiesterase [Microvirga makkahensis]|uniref:EAL domain-containing protein n=1 Tax=Microvirga makkahensis TaxID=1128670 RepID=A0A7X3MPC5_9HYPH|nr:EAL domain-containing protein [Microvirga makkahensis]MXQ10695.1 EAL domain-containing protein [Microvirga makkahensis]
MAVIAVETRQAGRISRARQNWRFSTKILLPVGAVVVLAITFTVTALFWAAHESNSVSAERQIRMVRHAIGSSVSNLVKEQQTIAIWDQAVQELNSPTTNWQWVDDEIGTWLYRLFGHDEVYILTPHDEPVYAMAEGIRAPATKFEEARASLHHIIDSVRGRQAHEIEEGLETLGGVADERVEAHAHFLDLNGRPVVASAMKFKPSTAVVVQQSGLEFLIVSIRYLDGRFLKELSEENLIEAPRFSRTDTASGNEQSVPLHAEDGSILCYFVWSPELPGTRILRILLPAAVIVLVMVVAAMLLLTRRLRRATLELQASEAHAQHLAAHDVLTGLPNRALFEERMEQALVRVRRGEKLAVLLLDLDRFKHVNDTFGHQAGDALIREFARRLSGLISGSDTIARVGGDEFAILKAEARCRKDIEAFCANILTAVSPPFDLLGHQMFVGLSIGVSLAPEMSMDRTELIRRADIALYHAKSQGRNRYCIFGPIMDETIKLRSMIEDDLRRALLSKDQLMVYFQPLISGVDERVVGLEALVRWEHPTRGLIPPSQFIPIAEDEGLILELGEWVFREACAASRRWSDLSIAINLSPVQIRSRGFAERCIEIARECQVNPTKLELEITEGILLKDDNVVCDTLNALREFGFRIALDDFGTGYSSLSYLKQFAVDKIKIDRSFVQSLAGTDYQEALAIIEALVSLGRAMGLAVSVEGVETKEQERLLFAAGCREMQGYLFSPALSQEQIAVMLSSRGR